jgi:hypothetical protein
MNASARILEAHRVLGQCQADLTALPEERP